MAFTVPLALSRPADVPVVPGADEARQWAQEELARQVYQDAKPGWAEQLAATLRKAFAELLSKIGVADANIGLAIVVALLLVAIVVIVLIIRPRVNRKTTAQNTIFADATLLSAKQHRILADNAAAAGDFGTAISEAFRAMVRAAEERDISMPALGRTATEIASELERFFPHHGQALTRSATLFNAVRYGKVPPTQSMYQEVLATDTAIAATTPRYFDDFSAATQ